jgi:DinB family protein
MSVVSPDRAALILARFNAAHNAFAFKLRDCHASAAEERPEDGGWSCAQIGWHVAKTNEWIASVLTGADGSAKPAPAGFRESFDASAVPDKLKTYPTLEPPAIVGRDLALERLRASGQHMSKAIASLTPDRGASYCVALPFGTLSLFELADFAAAHVGRHAAQLERVMAQV